MDWINFTVFFLVYLTLLQMLRQFNKDLPEPPCSELCQTVGYVDLWELMNTARISKIYLSVCVCIQLLKIIKFTNVLIPKMGLMTGVLGAGKMDLLFFGIIFGAPAPPTPPGPAPPHTPPLACGPPLTLQAPRARVQVSRCSLSRTSSTSSSAR